MNRETFKKLFWTDFRLHVAFTLLLVWLLAVWHFRTINSFLYPLLAVGLMTALDLSTTWIRNRKSYFPSASLVTGFLIGLIIAPTEPVWVIAAAVFLAFLSKQFIKAGPRQHIFNPAAFGIMATSLIFGGTVAWWGVSFSRFPLLILIPAMVTILWRLKRLWLPGAFLSVYYLYLITLTTPIDTAKTLADGTVLLFALVMLPEPMTSPAVGKFKYLFGPLVAVVSILIAITKLSGEIFLPALLFANLIGFLMLRRKAFSKT